MQISTADSLLRDLLERELVSRTKAVDGDVLTVSAPERHWFRVLEKDGKQFFARGGGAGLERERALYGAAGALDVLPPLRVAEDHLLVFETFGEGYDVIEFHRIGRRVAEWLPALIGRALALLHGLHVALPREQPARLRPAPGTAPAVAQAIARVAAGWTGETPIHGNAGFESIIVAPEPARRIHLIGFDDACLGDPAWDVGAVIEAYYAWSLEPKIVSDVEGPVCPLSPLSMQAAIASFWTTYTTAARIAPGNARPLLVRAFAYAGVHMIAHIEQLLRKPDQIPPRITPMMQAAIALMTAPAAAADAFFVPPRPAWPQQPWGMW